MPQRWGLWLIAKVDKRRHFSRHGCVVLSLIAIGGVYLPQVVRAQVGLPYLVDEEDPDFDDGDEVVPKVEADSASPKNDAGESIDIPAEAKVAPAPTIRAEAPVDGRPAAYFSELWAQRQAALGKGDETAAALRLAEMVEAKQAAGWPNFFVYGRAIAVQSQEALDANDLALATALASATVELAPDAAFSHRALAAVLFANGEYLPGLGSWTKAIYVSLREPPLLRVRLGNFLLALVCGLLLSSVAFAAISLCRYARPLISDLCRVMPAGARRWQAGLLLCAFALSPLLFRLGPAWWVLLWILCVGLYYGHKERLAAIAVLLVIAAVPLMLPKLTSHMLYPDSRVEDMYLGIRSLRTYDDGVLERLQKVEPRSYQVSYVLGKRAQWSGDLHRARTFFEEALSQGGETPELLTTVGNMRFLLGDNPGAIAAYQRAIALEPKHLVAHFNLSRVYYGIAEHRKAGDAHRLASAINMDRVELYDQEAQQKGARFIVPEAVPLGLLTGGVESDAVHIRAVEQIWSWIGGATGRASFAAFALLGIIALVLMVILHTRLHLSEQCPRCGRPAHLRRYLETDNIRQCGPCYQAFVAVEGVEEQMRITKKIAAHRYQAGALRVRRLLSVFIAGGGQLIRGASFQGIVLMTLFVAGVIGVLSALQLVPSVTAVPDTDSGSFGLAIAGLMAIFSYTFSLWDGVRER
ncbi:MAG: tetratricopeptide repeat protein [Myxococcota bacterium]